jgi:positive regulator of sigma E activity
MPVSARAVAFLRLMAPDGSGQAEWSRDPGPGCGSCRGLCGLGAGASGMTFEELTVGDAEIVRVELSARLLLQMALVLYVPLLAGFLLAVTVGFGFGGSDGAVAIAAAAGVTLCVLVTVPLRARVEREVRADLVATPQR